MRLGRGGVPASGGLRAGLAVGGLLLNDNVATIVGNGCTEADLRTAAGERSFERGIEYLDAVDDLAVLGSRVTAAVRGTDEYIVVLNIGGSARVSGACDCPYGKEGFFCKHCVAVGLAYLRSRSAARRKARPAASGATASAPPAAKPRSRGLQSWLNSLKREDLLLLVLDQLVEDDDWRGRLELRAASAAADVDAIAARLGALLDAEEFGQYGYIEEGEAGRYAKRVDTAASVVTELVSTGHAAQAVVVCEYAIGIVPQECRHARDPAGAIWAAAAGLVTSHHAACAAGQPDPLALADFLAGRLLSHDDLPQPVVASYRELLGAVGLDRLRETLMTAWRAGSPSSAESSSSAAQRAVEDFLRLTGDIEALVEVMSAGLAPTGAGHLRIAQELDTAGRLDESLDWAERGLRLPGRDRSAVPALSDYVVERYLAFGRAADAVAVRKEDFESSPDLGAFGRLRATAKETDTWPATRQWALDRLRADADATRRSHRGVRSAPGPVLIDALISEGDIDLAWDAAARIATEAQWLRLADLVATTRPADALAVYQRQIQALKQEVGDKAYERLARLLLSARACHARLGTQAAFSLYLRAVREDQKRKRRLISVLDGHGL
jgi:tetratricopeptide (TPR) repeat protein